MSIVVTNRGCIRLANAMTLGELSLCRLRLFVGRTPVLHTSVPGGFTEPVGSWYARQLTALWMEPVTDGAGHYQTVCGPLSWAIPAGPDVSIDGWVLVSADGADVVMGELFAATVVIPAGETWNLDVVFTDAPEF